MRALRVLLGVALDFSTCPREHRPTQPDMSPPTGLVTLGGASGTGPPTLSVPSVLLSPASGRVVGGGGEPRQMGGSGQFFDQHPAQDLGAVVAEDWQCLRRLAARVAATDGSAPDHRERCGPCRLLARIATPNRLDCLPPFWAAFCATWGEPTLLLLAALLFGLGLIVWDYGFGGLWYFLTNLDEPAVADTGRPAGARAARRRRRAGAWGSRGPQRVRRGWGGSRRRPAPLSGRPAYLRDLGTLLIALRGDKGLREAAARIGVPKSTLWRWENTDVFRPERRNFWMMHTGAVENSWKRSCDYGSGYGTRITAKTRSLITRTGGRRSIPGRCGSGCVQPRLTSDGFMTSEFDGDPGGRTSRGRLVARDSPS